VGTGGTAGRA